MLKQILLFGGTTQGKLVSKLLSKHKISHIYSTKTKVKFQESVYCKHISGELNAGTIAKLCKSEEVSLIVDASHPFAEMLHEEISTAAEWTNLPLYRYERESIGVIHNPLIHYCKSYSHVIETIQKLQPQRVLATTGVNTIQTLSPLRENQSLKMWVRILNRESSIKKALADGMKREFIIAEDAPISTAQELCLIQKLNIDCVISKDSGTTGGLEYKISACLAQQIPIIIIQRPKLQNNYMLFFDELKLLHAVKKCL